ncbi:dihydroxy-acid dehydratase, partial [Candidatus Microgenomates bacterium]|nr:dihydroxy-acid dehydratase [Candidatus Microgenomates bacterium]
GIVALSTCDKIVPAQLMALSAINLPSIMVTGGYMLPGRFKDKTITVDYFTEKYPDWRDKRLSEDDFMEIETCCCPSVGACSMMGTANTFCCLTEALGMSLPDNAVTSAVESKLFRIGRAAGRKIMELLEKNIRPRDIMTKEAIENALMVHSAIGGSTNAVLHMPAIINKLGLELPLDHWNEISKKAPHLVSVTTGSKYTMRDFDFAGGIQSLMKEMSSILNLDVLTVTGTSLKENLKNVTNKNPDMIRPMQNPVHKDGSIAILKGNLAPFGAVVKQTAVHPNMLSHRGPAIVFDSEEDAKEALSANLIKKGHVVVIRYEGPKGGPGMREMFTFQAQVSGLGLDEHVALVTDGRFSGFTRGPAIGHASPEAIEGSPMAIVRDGDIIEYDIPNKTIHLCLSDEEIQKRLKLWKKPESKIKEGFLAEFYAKVVLSADKGAIWKV